MAEATRVPTAEEIKAALESGQIKVTDLGEQSKAVYDAMLAEGTTPEVTGSSVLRDPYQAVADITRNTRENVGEFFGGDEQYQTSTGQNIPDPYGGTSLPELALGGLETGLSFASGVPALAAATVAGGFEGIKGALHNKGWYETMKDASESINNVMGDMMYVPRTSAGKDINAVANAPFMLIDEGTTAAQNFVQSMMGGNVNRTGADPMIVTQFQLAADEIQGYRDRGETVPDQLYEKANSLRGLIGQQGGFGQAVVNNKALFAGISTKALLDFLPDLAGKGRSATVKIKKAHELRKIAKELGVDLRGLPEDQILALANSTDILTGGQTVVAQRLGSLAERLKRQEEITRNTSNQLFEAAKSSEAYYPQVQLKLLDQSMADLLATEQFDLANLRVASGRLEKFNEIVSDTAFDLVDKDNNFINGYVPINKLHNFRQLLNSDINKMRRSTDYEANSEYQALLGMKNHVDEFIDSQFNADLVAGNAEAITKWKKANDWYVDYKKKFNASDAVQKIVDKDLTPEQVKNLILGTGEVVGRAEAGSIVQKMNSIFGNDSPQMEALRKEVIFGISIPLLSDTPDIQSFIQRVDNLKRKSPTLVNELFQGDALKNLENLQGLARAQLRVVERTGASSVAATRIPSLSRILALNLAPGNTGLAKGSAGIQITKAILEPLTRQLKNVVGNPVAAREIMSEFYSTPENRVNMNRPFMGLQNFPTIGATQATRRAQEEESGGESLDRLQGMSQRLRDFSTARQQ